MYRNRNLSPEDRARALLSVMTLDEKIDQMIFIDPMARLLKSVDENDNIPSGTGTFGNLNKLGDDHAVDKIQKHFTENTRLGIPLFITFESLHGLYDNRATVFPQCAACLWAFFT